MAKRKIRLMNILICALFILSSTTVVVADPNESASQFELTSGDGLVLTLDDLRDKVTLMYFESRDTLETNTQLKNQVSALRENMSDSQRNTFKVIPVVDASSANMFTKSTWKKKMRKNSLESGFDVYGDWNGEMRQHYQFVENESNVILISSDLKILQRFAGPLSRSRITALIQQIELLSVPR